MKGPRRILVVDDQAEIADLARMVLTDGGYEVTIASSGREALKRVHDEGYDLVLLDITMPGMDGWETLRLLRSDPEGSPPPVVMFSVKNEIRDKVHGLQEGALDYITKPFSVDELLSRVQRILGSLEEGGAGRSAALPVP